MDIINYDPTRPHISDMEGKRVVRGPDWCWGSQDKFPGNVGTVLGLAHANNPKYLWVQVQWDNGSENSYRWGLKDDGAPRFDLEIVEGEAAEPKEEPKVESKFKVGDRVDHTMDATGYKNGEVLEVRDHGATIKIRWPSGSICIDPAEKLVPHVKGEAEEAAEEPEPEVGENPAGPKAIGCRVKLNEDGLEKEGEDFEDREGTLDAWDGDDEGLEAKILFDAGDELWTSAEYVEIVALPAAKAAVKAEPEKPKFKIGDRVTGKSNLGEPETGEVNMVDPNPHTSMTYRIRTEGGAEVWMENEGLRLADTPERDEGEFKPGDQVRVKASVTKPRFGWGAVSPGDVGTVTSADGHGEMTVDFPEQEGWLADPPDMELVTAATKHEAKPPAPGTHPTGPEFIGAKVRMLPAAGEACGCPYYHDFKDGTLTITKWDEDDALNPILAENEDGDDHWFNPDHLEVVAMPGTPEADPGADTPKADEQASEGATLDLTGKQLAPFEAMPMLMKAVETALGEAKDKADKVFAELARQFGFENLDALHKSGLRISIERKTGKAILNKNPDTDGKGMDRKLTDMLGALLRGQ